MAQNDAESLWGALSGAERQADQSIWAPDSHVSLRDLAAGSSLSGRPEELRGRAVLVVSQNQLTAALALIQIDGIARRLILCPPDLNNAYIPSVMEIAEVDAVISDQTAADLGASNVDCFIQCSPRITLSGPVPGASDSSEWIMFTSGTSGIPKMARA
jgi:hypothetical protein